MTLKVVYDTNVVVSAALKPGSIPASLVALAMAKQERLFLSPAILEEYTEVLKRPKFGLDAGAVDRFLRVSAEPRPWSVPRSGSVPHWRRPITGSSSVPKKPVQSIW